MEKKRINTEDAIILTCSVNVGALDDSDIPEYINSVADMFTDVGTNIIAYIIPKRSGNTEVKVLTPKLTSKKKTKEIETQLEGFVSKVSQLETHIRALQEQLDSLTVDGLNAGGIVTPSQLKKNK